MRLEIEENIAREALSLAYSRMGQRDDQGVMAHRVAVAIHAALTKADRETDLLVDCQD
jgi:hypothetical protein